MSRNTSNHGAEVHPDTLCISSFYEKQHSLNSVKQPLYLTSTFAFNSAEEGLQFFSKWAPSTTVAASGTTTSLGGDSSNQFIYSRLSNPNLELFEKRMAVWDKCDSSLLFSSGMAAISTAHISLVNKPDQYIISSAPVYASVNENYEMVLGKFGVKHINIPIGNDDQFIERLRHTIFNNRDVFNRLRIIHLESPSNPTNQMIDIEAVCKIRDELNRRRNTQSDNDRVVVTVDNTFLGPVFQSPRLQGADIIMHSATKFLGGHGDLIAGTCSGPKYLIDQMRQLRKILGSMCDPFTAWLLIRSMETLRLRMEKQASNATRIAHFLSTYDRKLVLNVVHPSLLDKSSDQYRIFRSQCTGYGSLIAFEIAGGQPAVFRFLNALKVVNLAVSLGGTESNCQHPWSGTHLQLTQDQRIESGVSEGLVRFSVGIEHVDDLINDLKSALEAVDHREKHQLLSRL